MSNDVLLIMPGQIHEFTFSETIEIYNCQFFIEALDPLFLKIVNKLSFPNLRSVSYATSEKREPLFNNKDLDYVYSLKFAPLNLQGIIHLSHSQSINFEMMLKKIMTESLNRSEKYLHVIKNSLEELLIILERIMTNQFKDNKEVPQKHKKKIENVLQYVDNNYQEHLNFDDIASIQNLSPNYFRRLFKVYTGSSPIDHLNRIRVLKALELIRDYNCYIGDVAAQVGIYDANYFSRVFKKYLGYPPSHFAIK